MSALLACTTDTFLKNNCVRQENRYEWFGERISPVNPIRRDSEFIS